LRIPHFQVSDFSIGWREGEHTAWLFALFRGGLMFLMYQFKDLRSKGMNVAGRGPCIALVLADEEGLSVKNSIEHDKYHTKHHCDLS
jgi:hypothetical protein